MDWIAIALLGIATGLVVTTVFLVARKTTPLGRLDRRRLREFTDELGGDLEPGDHGGLNGTLIKGELTGRRVTLQLGACVPGSRYVVQFGVEVDSTVKLRIQLASLLGRLKRALGGGYVQTGKFLIASEDEGGAQDVFVHGGPELLELLDQLLNDGHTEEIVAENGWLYLQCDLGALDPRWFRWFFSRMIKVARFYERRPIRIKEKASAPDGFAWTGGGEEARCPYCHDALPEDVTQLVSCEECQTLHHGECFDEHGGCTIYGCQGRQAGPLRA